MKPIRLLGLLLVLSCFACEKEASDPRGAAGAPGTPSAAYAQYGTPFAEVPTAADVVMYEVNLRAFGPGGLRSVIDRLDDIQALGINVIWLMPIYPIGTVNSVNSPYSVRDYKAVSAEYGSLVTLRELTDAAHARGMAVILDWVANHTAWDHPWIDNAGWYTTDASGRIIHPAGTNWLDVADLNFANPDMRLALIDAMKYWVLEANVDGYRCDYADGVPADFWAQAFDTLAAIPDREFVLLAEGARADHFQAGFDLNFGWDFYGALKDVFTNGQPASRLIEVHRDSYRNIPAGHEQLRFTTNHDESAWDRTPLVIFGGQAGALAASVGTIFTGGAPLIYGSQEVGRENTLPFFSTSQLNWAANPGMREAYAAVLNFYRRTDVARRGTLTGYPADDVLCFSKALDGAELLVLVNVRSEARDFALPAALQNSTWTDGLADTVVDLETTLPLAGFGYRLLLR